MNPPACDRRAIPAGMNIESWSAPDGWWLRSFDWAAEGDSRGSLLFLNGRGDFIEKYLEAADHWYRRGWRVSGFDWRGQGGSGRIDEGGPGCEALLDRLLDDATAYARAWMGRSPGPHVLVGHSMGGHLALRLMAERQIAVDAAVLVAPMLGLNSAPLPERAAREIARMLCRIGVSRRPAWDERARHAPDGQWRLTGCKDRFADAAWWKQAQPELAMPAPSWGWLAAAYASTARLEAAGALEAVDVPCLILATERDRLVSFAAIRRAVHRLPDARLLTFPTPGHEILREADATRVAAFAAIDDFLDGRAPRR